MTCDHELNCVDEYWFNNEELQVTLECSLCHTRFRGSLVSDKLVKEADEDGNYK